jgi:hypothetical protein
VGRSKNPKDFSGGGPVQAAYPHPKSLARTLSLRAATRFRPPHEGEVKSGRALFPANLSWPANAGHPGDAHSVSKEELLADLASTRRTQLGGPHSRAMTVLFLGPTDNNVSKPPPCGEVEKSEGFFGWGAGAGGLPPPEISCAYAVATRRYEISTSPQGGGKKRQRLYPPHPTCHGPRMRATQVTRSPSQKKKAPRELGFGAQSPAGWPAFAGHDSCWFSQEADDIGHAACEGYFARGAGAGRASRTPSPIVPLERKTIPAFRKARRTAVSESGFG